MTTDRRDHIRMVSPSSTEEAVDDLTRAINGVPTPFIPQSPTIRDITERPISRDDLRIYRETVVRAHRMIESALDKLIGA